MQKGLVSIFADVQDAVLEIQVEASSSDIEEDFTFNCLTCGEKFAEMHLLKKHEQIHLKDACEEVLSIQIPKPQVDSLNQMEIATGMTNNALFLILFYLSKLHQILCNCACFSGDYFRLGCWTMFRLMDLAGNCVLCSLTKSRKFWKR